MNTQGSHTARAGVMTVSDEDLARARKISIAQVRLLRASRGTTNETLEALSDAGFRQALHRLAYPDRPALRTEFRYRQALGEVAPSRHPCGLWRRRSPSFTSRRWRCARTNGGSADGLRRYAAPEAEAGLSVAAWQWLGPGNIGGRIRGIVIDPGDSQPDVGRQRRRRCMAHTGRRCHLGDGR